MQMIRSRSSSYDSHREEKTDEDYVANHTGGGVPLYKLVHVTNIPYIHGGCAAVNWNSETNQFLVCESGQDDWAIDRNEATLRALAKLIAFNPKEWGCHRCGCSAEFKDQERVCGCDACQKDGCCTPVRMENDNLAPLRVKSQYFKKREHLSLPLPLLPPPPPRSVSLQRFMTLGDLGQPVNPIGVIMEDAERDKWFRNPLDRSNMFKGS